VNVVNVGAAMVVGDVVVGAGGIVVVVGAARAVVEDALVVVKIFYNHIINYVTLND